MIGGRYFYGIYFCLGKLIFKAILIIQTKKSSTPTGIRQDVTIRIAMASIKLLSIFSRSSVDVLTVLVTVSIVSDTVLLALSNKLEKMTEFYNMIPNAHEETRKRIEFFKHVIEDREGYKRASLRSQ